MTLTVLKFVPVCFELHKEHVLASKKTFLENNEYKIMIYTKISFQKISVCYQTPITILTKTFKIQLTFTKKSVQRF